MLALRRASGDVFASIFCSLITRRAAPNTHNQLAESYYQILYHPQAIKVYTNLFFSKAPIFLLAKIRQMADTTE